VPFGARHSRHLQEHVLPRAAATRGVGGIIELSAILPAPVPTAWADSKHRTLDRLAFVLLSCKTCPAAGTPCDAGHEAAEALQITQQASQRVVPVVE